MTTGSRGDTSTGLVCRKELKHFLKKDQQYPLLERAENRILTAAPKSVCCVQILWNLNSWDLIIPANVCLGWKLVLNSRACVSVGLKKTFNIQFVVIEEIWALECGRIQKINRSFIDG